MGLTKQESSGVQPKNGDLRVWWIPQIGIDKIFEIPVSSIAEAKLLLKTLGDYDLFQLENNIKPDYSNAGGLSVYDSECFSEDGNYWTEWYNDDGAEIDEVDSEGNTLE